MKMDKDTIKHLAWLARIELNDDDVDMYREQISKIVEYLDLLDEADANAEPRYITTNIDDLRSDVAEEHEHKHMIDIIPNKKDRFVKAPKMV